MFVLIVDNFGIDHVGENHIKHLQTTLTNNYTIIEHLDGKQLAGINLKWNYTTNNAHHTCCPSVYGYIANLLLKLVHEAPTKPKLSPHRQLKIIYSSKEQFAAEDDTSPKLTDASIKRVKDIVGALLYYTRAINNIILEGISMIGDQEAAATEKTAAALDQLLDHVATYPDYGIIY